MDVLEKRRLPRKTAPRGPPTQLRCCCAPSHGCVRRGADRRSARCVGLGHGRILRGRRPRGRVDRRATG
eukprot:750644-Prymnesium_polylepis.1